MTNTAGPIIFQGTTQTTNSSAPTRRPSLLMGLIILVLVIAAAYAGYLFLRSNNSPLPVNVSTPPLPIGDGQLTLSSQTSAPKVGQPVTLNLQVNTGGHTIQGVDVLLTYDPQILTVDPNYFFVPGTMFGEYPVIAADPAKGQIRISGIASLSKIGFNGIGSFGKLTFTPTKAGSTRVTINYAANQTTDSNMIEYGSGQDVLGQGHELNLNINQ